MRLHLVLLQCITGFSGNALSPDFVKRREKGLQRWLQAIVAALPGDDPLLNDALAPASARRRGWSAIKPVRSREASTPSSPASDRIGLATTPEATPIAASNADELQKAAKRVAGLQWELVWEAPEEAEGDFALPDLD